MQKYVWHDHWLCGAAVFILIAALYWLATTSGSCVVAYSPDGVMSSVSGACPQSPYGP
jgi:hypothetical protein